MTAPKGYDFSIFLCRCGDQNAAESQKVLDFVKEKLKADDSNLVSHVVISLNWDYEAGIKEILNDMWSAVIAESYNEEKPFKVWIECDSIEDGFAGAWKAFYDKFGEVK